MTNTFYKKLQKNGKIILFDGEGRGISSLDVAGCWKLIKALESPSSWFEKVQFGQYIVMSVIFENNRGFPLSQSKFCNIKYYDKICLYLHYSLLWSCDLPSI